MLTLGCASCMASVPPSARAAGGGEGVEGVPAHRSPCRTQFVGVGAKMLGDRAVAEVESGWAAVGNFNNGGRGYTVYNRGNFAQLIIDNRVTAIPA